MEHGVSTSSPIPETAAEAIATGPKSSMGGCSIKVTRVSILRGGLTRKEELASPSAVAARSRRAAADCLAILAEDAGSGDHPASSVLGTGSPSGGVRAPRSPRDNAITFGGTGPQLCRASRRWTRRFHEDA